MAFDTILCGIPLNKNEDRYDNIQLQICDSYRGIFLVYLVGVHT